MPKFKITATARFGKDRPTVSDVVEADNAKLAQQYFMRAVAQGAVYEIEEVQERRPTLRAAQ